MILQFSDTTNKKGIVQTIRRRTKTSTSSTSYSLEDLTVDVNFALSNFFIIANKAAGRWQPVDDSNHDTYPILTAHIVAGQQAYTPQQDADGNQIQNIYKVRRKDPSGKWVTLRQRDMEDNDDDYLNDDVQGIPETYDLTATGIFLHQIPNYSQDDSLEIYVSRGGSYFESTDTNKQAGIPEQFNEYLTLRPSYFYCLENQLPQASDYGVMLFGRDGQSGMEGEIKDFYSKRNKAVQNILSGEYVNSI